MSFPRYERYKDSGVDWLGEIPEHWDLKRLILLASINDDALAEDTNSDFEIEYVDISSVTPGSKILAAESMTFGSAPSRARRIAKSGDILVSTVRTYLRAIAPVIDPPENLIVSTGFAVLRPREYCSHVFLNYALQAASFIEEVIARSTGVSYPAINAHDLVFINLPLPLSKQDQDRIGLFIETETTKIDVLIEEQRKLIELLKEKRQAVIFHAVTKGINTDVSMRESAVEWLGHIPEHWQIVPLRFLVKFISGGTPDKKEPMYWEGSIPWVSAKDMKVKRIDEAEDHISESAVIESGLKLIPAGYLLMVVRGMILAHSLPVALTCGTVTINQDLKAIKCRDNINATFLQFVFEGLKSHIIANAGESAHGTKKLESEMLGRLEIPVPPVQEQQRIVAEIDRQVEQLDAVGHSATQAIELLRERRNALISAAVTGKIDVRAYMAKPVMSATQYSPGFAHQLLAAEILDRCNSQRMGRIKLQKLIHLCEYHAQVSEVQGDYSRKAAGPFDAKAMAGISKNLKKQKWFEEVKEGERYVYRPLEKRGEHKKYLAHWQAEMPRINVVLSLLGNFRTRECEIVSTLYAAWNDLLIDGGPTDDATILHEASSAERWHKSKEQIAPERWTKALQWMEEKGLVPVGYGKHTRHAAGQIGTTTEEAHEPA